MSAAGVLATPSHLHFDPLDEKSWRLRDLTVDPHDAASVVAYVERRPSGRYDVTWLAPSFGNEVIADADQLLQRAGERLGGREVQPWTS